MELQKKRRRREENQQKHKGEEIGKKRSRN